MITDKMLEENTTPWGLLSQEMREAFREHPITDLEEYSGFCGWIVTNMFPTESSARTLRKRTIPLTKPDIPWGFIRPKFKWAARSGSGLVFAYQKEPVLYTKGECWLSTRASILIDNELLAFDPGTCDWKDSLVQRPD